LALVAIDFVDGSRGYGHDGTCLWFTATAGRSWTLTHCPPDDAGRGAPIEAIRFVSPDVGWIQMTTALLRTTDGGRTWKPTDPRPDVLFGFDFADAERGWWVGFRLTPSMQEPKGVIFRTDDGGATWVEQAPGTEPLAREYFHAVWAGSADDVWVAGSAILHSTDGGNAWQPAAIDRAALSARRNVSIQFAGPAVGWIRRNPAETFFLTVDGGRHWQERRGPSGIPFNDDLLFVDESRGWLAGGTLFVTADGARTWQEAFAAIQGAPADASFYDLDYLPSARIVLAAGDHHLAACQLP
jgi:photosystem II stability/assembly factor-like uncharacterized protein